MTDRVAALVVAAGRGTRLSSSPDDLPKQYRHIGSASVLSHTLNALARHPDINVIVTVIGKDDHDLFQTSLQELPSKHRDKCHAPVIGGDARQQSVRNGLEALNGLGVQYVLIHDGARPFVSQDIISGNLALLQRGSKAVLTAIPVVDTIKRATEQGVETVDRSDLWAAQTPQSFPVSDILEWHQLADGNGSDGFTDDIGLAEWQGAGISICEGSPDNFKITTPADLQKAERQADHMTTEPLSSSNSLVGLGDIRVGQGYDVHAFEDGEAVILGGVSIPHSQKLKGHSDADVVLHAITDAVLGGLADGDIGSHFPPSDPQWKGAASDQFLVHALNLVRKRGGRVAHIDVTVVCEAPKIGPHRDALRQSVAEICDLPIGRVSVKATTSERLGFTGRKEGIACLATATLRLPFSDTEE